MKSSDSLIHLYEKGPEILTYAAQGLTVEQQQARPGPGAWSIAELVAHLTDTEMVHALRMRFVLAEDNPSMPGFDESLWIDRLHSHDMPVDEALALFTQSRRWMTRILRQCSEEDLARKGLHGERGPESLTRVLSFAAHHVDHHLKFLYAKRANLGVSLFPRYTSE